MKDDEEQELSPLTPNLMFRSFLAIAMGALSVVMLRVVVYFSVMAVGYPEISQNWHEALGQPTEEFEKTVRDNPQIYTLPAIFHGTVLGFEFLLALLAGVLTAMIAPAGKTGHGLVLSLLVIVTLFNEESVQRIMAPAWYQNTSPILLALTSLVTAGAYSNWHAKRTSKNES